MSFLLRRDERDLLETQRDTIINKVEHVSNGVAQGAITPNEAEGILTQQHGPNYLADAEFAHTTLAKDDVKRRTIAIIGIFLVLAIPLMLISNAGLTGFAFLAIDRPETIELNLDFSESTTFITDLDETITSLRATGVYQGRGGFRLTHIDGSGSERLLFEHVAEEIPEDAVILGAAGVELEEIPPREVTFAGQCVETCDINSSPSHQIRIEVTDGILTFESMTYTTRILVNESEPPEEVLEVEPLPEDVDLPLPEPEEPIEEAIELPPEVIEDEPVNETPAPVNETPTNNTPVNETPINETPVNVTPINNTPVNITPINDTQTNETQPIEQPVDNCQVDSQCDIGVCRQSTYQGQTTAKICTRTDECVLGADRYLTGEIIGDSQCFNGAWISTSGRWQIENAEGEILMAIDRYGTLAVRGQLTEDTNLYTNGWHLTDDSGDIVASLDREEGNLRIHGRLTENIAPSGDGLIIENAEGEIQAVLKENGDIELRGSIIEGVELI